MKSAYELAMERLEKSAPTVKLSADQKKQIAELESVYGAKIAARELTLNGEIAQAIHSVWDRQAANVQLPLPTREPLRAVS